MWHKFPLQAIQHVSYAKGDFCTTPDNVSKSRRLKSSALLNMTKISNVTVYCNQLTPHKYKIKTSGRQPLV